LLNDPAAALADWKRLIYAGLALMGLGRLKASFYQVRQKFRRVTQPQIYSDRNQK
jgi:hypothetical protein